MSMNFVNGSVTIDNMWEDLEKILSEIDLDFTGANGEEYYTKEGISQMDSAIFTAKDMECEQERIDYVIEKCKDYSSGYYDDFKYIVISTGENTWEVVICTYNSF